jgi:hypothetical protein
LPKNGYFSCFAQSMADLMPEKAQSRKYFWQIG